MSKQILSDSPLSCLFVCLLVCVLFFYSNDEEDSGKAIVCSAVETEATSPPLRAVKDKLFTFCSVYFPQTLQQKLGFHFVSIINTVHL